MGKLFSFPFKATKKHILAENIEYWGGGHLSCSAYDIARITQSALLSCFYDSYSDLVCRKSED